MRLNVIESVAPERWDARLQALGGTIYHSTTWARYVASANPNCKPCFFTWGSENGDAAGMALGFLARSGRRWLAPFTGRLSLDSTPLVGPGEETALADFLAAITGYAREMGCTEIEVGSSASCRGGQELEDLGFEITRRLEFVLDLQHTEEELWQAMDPVRRQKIRKAVKQGVVLRNLSGQEGLAELRRLQAESGQRILNRGGPDIGRRGAHPADPVLTLLQSGWGHLVGAVVGGEVVSAGLFTCFNELVYHTLSGHGRRALETQAPTLLLWETIKRYQREGARRFNLSGCKITAVQEGSPEHGVYVYKRDFGGERIDCASGHKVLRRSAYKAVRFLKSLLDPHRQFK